MYITVTQILISAFTTTVCVWATTETYVIPLSINPFIQNTIKLSGTVEVFYKTDEKFYSSVTLTDVSINTQQDLKELVTKKLSVIFLTTVSSYVAKTLTVDGLTFTMPNKWSYRIPIEDMIIASNGSITELSQDMEAYRFQELGMKVLQNRYGFNVSKIQSDLGLTTMEFYGANEKQWVDIVGIITNNVIESRSEKLNLTPCYLASLVNKTLMEMKAFTLDEIDTYLYNTTSLMEKQPAFRNKTLTEFYAAFNITPTQWANDSNVNSSFFQSTGLTDQIQYFVGDLLRKFHLKLEDISPKYQEPDMDILVPCPEEWDSFKSTVVLAAFENEARNMSITNRTLASLIGIVYEDVKKLSFEEMKNLIINVIKPVKEKKRAIEQTRLFKANVIDSSDHNAFDVIQSMTNFTKRHLSLLYSWTDVDYHFSERFSVAELAQTCSSEVYNYSLLTLAKLNVGEVHVTDGSSCKVFNALRTISDKATVNQLEKTFSVNHSKDDDTLEYTLRSLTNASSQFIYRVLNSSSEVQELCANVSIHHLSLVTPHTVSQLKYMTFQDIISLVVKLKQNGSLYQIPKMTTSESFVSLIGASLTERTISSTNKQEIQSETLSPTHIYIYTNENRETKSVTDWARTNPSIISKMPGATQLVMDNTTTVHATTSSMWTSDFDARSTTIGKSDSTNKSTRSPSARPCISKLEILISILISAIYQWIQQPLP